MLHCPFVLRRIGALSVLFVALPAAAQVGPRVVLLAPDAQVADWRSALQVELAATGGEVLTGAPPAAPAAHAREAEARTAAREVQADAAVWVESDERGRLTVRIVELQRETARSAPLLGDPDGRTVALLAASLLEEPEPAPIPADTLGVGHALASPFGPAAPSAAAYEPPPAPPASVGGAAALPPPPSGGPQHGFARAWVAFGLAGFALTHDRAFDPGSLFRAAVGVELAGWLRIGGLYDVGLVRERYAPGLVAQPWMRWCPEVAVANHFGRDVSLHVGAHGCVSFAQLASPDFGGGIPGFPGPDPVLNSWGLGASGGGFFALSFRASPSMYISIRGDLDGAVVSQSRAADFVPVLSSLVGFE